MPQATIHPAPIAARFPRNQHIQRLLDKAAVLGVNLVPGHVPQQWLYHPEERTIFVWEPDLSQESLSFLTVILAHELGHVMDFDAHPEHVELIRYLHWSQVPHKVEHAAFVNAFLLLKELSIPISLEQYGQMIDEPMASHVTAALEQRLCCLLSDREPEPAALGQAAS